MEQRSPEWFAARLGKVTASRIADVCARTKSGWGAGRKNYMADLVAERLTGVKSEGFTNAAMQWGTDMEPEARVAYEFYRDATVAETGFVPHPSIAETGASLMAWSARMVWSRSKLRILQPTSKCFWEQT
jgi:hypothetical protein